MRIRGRSADAKAEAGESSRPSAVEDALWTAQDRTRTGSRRALEALWATLRDRVFWPLRDRAELAGAPARALGAGALVLLAAVAGVAALLWAAPDHHGTRQTTVAEVAAPVSQPAPAPSKPAQPPAPTLHGAAPVFESGGADKATGTGGVEAGAADSGASETPAKSAVDSGGAAASGGDEAAATKISSRPGSSPSSASTSAASQSRPARGPVAGPAAVAVARRFATAFVSYEVGGAEDPAVRDAFAATTAPDLEQALLQRPPRLPANARVPKAKVLNVVPAPSRNHLFPVSVSLLRVGTTSELRLELQKQKGQGWLVTNVLG
jgi:hypothetical protein